MALQVTQVYPGNRDTFTADIAPGVDPVALCTFALACLGVEGAVPRVKSRRKVGDIEIVPTVLSKIAPTTLSTESLTLGSQSIPPLAMPTPSASYAKAELI